MDNQQYQLAQISEFIKPEKGIPGLKPTTEVTKEEWDAYQAQQRLESQQIAIAVGIGLFVLLWLINAWRRGRLRAWLNRAKVEAQKFLPVMLVFHLVACTYPDSYSSKPMSGLNRNADYSVTETKGGFTISIQYSRYQMIPETQAVLEACKSELLSAASEHAESKGKRIKAINEQRMKLSTGRNGLSGITSCSASVPVEYR